MSTPREVRFKTSHSSQPLKLVAGTETQDAREIATEAEARPARPHRRSKRSGGRARSHAITTNERITTGSRPQAGSLVAEDHLAGARGHRHRPVLPVRTQDPARPTVHFDLPAPREVFSPLHEKARAVRLHRVRACRRQLTKASNLAAGAARGGRDLLFEDDVTLEIEPRLEGQGQGLVLGQRAWRGSQAR